MILSHDWYKHADEVLECNEVGDLRLNWLYEHHAGNRLVNELPKFLACYKMLEDRGHIGQRKKFGEMPGDSYMWIEKCTHSKVIIYECQSAMFLYSVKELEHEDEKHIKGAHIRQLYYKHSLASTKVELKECTLAAYRKIDFDIGGKESPHFCRYADGRDQGYIASLKLIFDIMKPQVEDATRRTFSLIGYMNFWVHPTQHPEEYD